MEWLNPIITVITALTLGLFLKNYLPSYMSRKGENLATKEDIAKITKLTEEVKIQFNKDMEYFKTDLAFKGEYRRQQYVELYADLYKNIAQSEYMRVFFSKLDTTKNWDYFTDLPYLEQGGMKHTTTVKYSQEGTKIENESIPVQNEITETNKYDGAVKSYWERYTINTPIQGTAADILKLSMARLLDGIAQRPYIRPLFDHP